MDFFRLPVRRIVFWGFAGLLFAALAPSCVAQAPPQEWAKVALLPAAEDSQDFLNHSKDFRTAASEPIPPPARCDISSLKTCLHDLLHDQAGIWTSPLRLHWRDALWLAPLGAATAVSINNEPNMMRAFGDNPTRVRISNDFTNLGSEYFVFPAAATIYTIGKITHNEKARETGVLTIEALIDAEAVTEALKLATNRERPNAGNRGRFWADDSDIYTLNGSFPSGHATISFAFARVISAETPGNLWLHVGLYALAGAVGVGRVTGRNHFPSDVLVGSTIGYLVGGYVYRQHSQFYGARGSPFTIGPVYNPMTQSYGVGVSFDPAALHGSWVQQAWDKARSTGQYLTFQRGGN